MAKAKRLTAAELVADLPNLDKRKGELEKVEAERARLGAEFQRLTVLVDCLRSVDEVVDGIPLQVHRSESHTSFSPLGEDLEYTRRAEVRGSGENYPPTQWLLSLDGNWRGSQWREYDDRDKAEAAAKRYAVYGILPGLPQTVSTPEA